ncbi:MAG TPA: sigma factor, partial [Dehalococcoidia bacterium]
MSEAALIGIGHPRAGTLRLASDARLVRIAVRGERRAFAAIFRRYHQELFRYCRAILGDGEEAADALQNTMVKVMRALPGESRGDRAATLALSHRSQRGDRPRAATPALS